MKNVKILLQALAIFLCFAILTACGKIPPSECPEHTGEVICKDCGLNYFDELTKIIQSKAPDNSNTITASTDNVDSQIEYDAELNCVLVSLVYKNIKPLPVVFLMTMKPATGSVYGWALSYDGKLAGGTFDAEQVTNIVFEPPIEYNNISNEIFNELDTVYKESVSFCADMLYSLLANDNLNNLTIENLGFKNYTPNVDVA